MRLILEGTRAGMELHGDGFEICSEGPAIPLPLVLAVFWVRARRWLDRLAALTRRVPSWTGSAFVVLGAWSVYLGADA